MTKTTQTFAPASAQEIADHNLAKSRAARNGTREASEYRRIVALRAAGRKVSWP
jgi:hypothetical protein